MIHALKILPEYFEAVISGKKTFEVRENDRGFKVGDLLALNEWMNGEYTDNSCLVYVDYILESAYCDEGYVVMSIKPCSVFFHTEPFDHCKLERDYRVPYATKKEGAAK